MTKAYQIHNQDEMYFVTFTIVDWVDIFISEVFCNIIIDSFKYCQKNKGLNIHAYAVMTNHVHAILSSKNHLLSDTIRDFKRHTASQILLHISKKNKCRADWILKRFEFAARKNKRNTKHQIWQHKMHALELLSAKFTKSKLTYIHNNPVKSGLVDYPDQWRYSSQRNYMDKEGIIDVSVLDFGSF